MKAALAALLLVTACGRAAMPAAEATASPSTNSSAVAPTPTALARSDTCPPSACPTSLPAASSPSLAASTYGVIVDLRTGPGYTVSLVGTDGRIAAQAHAALRSLTPDPGVAQLPYVSISRSRVYYLDGDSVVRWLDPTGGSGTGPSLPGTNAAPVAFAVSPDDTRIAVSRFDFSSNPGLVQLYTQSMDGGNQRYIFKSTTDYVWPVGWHAGNLVLAAQTFPPYSRPGAAEWNPYGAMSYHVVNPDNADRLYTLGDGEVQQGGCQPTGPMTEAGTACSRYGHPSDVWGMIGIVDWTGQFHTVGGPLHTPSSVEVSSVSSDAASGQLIFCCDTFSNFFIAGPNGYVNTQLPGGVQPVGTDWACWLDGTHLLSGSVQSVSLSVYAMGDKAASPVSARGFCAGVLPAALG